MQVHGIELDPARRRLPRAAKLVQVIHVEAVAGLGDDKDPVRVVDQFWSLDGELIAERDPLRTGVAGPLAMPLRARP